MLDANLKTQLSAYLEKVSQPIRIEAWLDASAAAQEMSTLLQEIAGLSPLIQLHERRDAAGQRAPSFTVGRPDEPAGIGFAGIPMGHEFTSLVLALLHVGGHPPKIEQALADQIRALPGPYRFETYISLSCQNCPDVVQALNLMAVLNPQVEHVMIDGALFQDEVNERQIMSVPTVFMNGERFGQGRMSIEEIVAKLDTGAAERAARELTDKEPFDVLVVGGGPAGAAAAIYAARKGIRTGVAAERFGGQVLDTLAIENFISVSRTEGPQLAAAMEAHVRDYDVDIMNLQRASRLVPGDELIQVEFADGGSLKARSVVLATGARWRQLGVPGEDEYRNKGVAYCPHCDGPLFKGKHVAVIGGGNSGVEAAIDLAGIVGHVTLIEYDAQLRADAVLQRKVRSLANVTVITAAQTTQVLGDGNKVTGLVYRDRETSSTETITLDGVFVQIGLLPNTEWLKDAVALSERGEIEIDARGQTSIPGVFAAGDCTTVPYKQVVIAMGQGSTAALSAFDHLIRTSAPAEAEDAAGDAVQTRAA